MYLHLSSVDSTSTLAKALLENYTEVIVSADHQTGGRGRNGKTWVGDPGANVYLSFGYRHQQVVGPEYALFSMAFPTLVVLDVIRNHVNDTKVRIKYPNDIQVKTGAGWAKISGVLVEHEFEGSRCAATTIGIGINVRQTEFAETITQPCTSLRLQGINVSSASVREQIIEQMATYPTITHNGVILRWKAELDLINKLVFVEASDETWNIERIMTDGRLIVRGTISHQERTIDNGDTIRYID